MFDVQVCHGSFWTMHGQGFDCLRGVFDSLSRLRNIPDRVVVARRMASTMRAPAREFPRATPYLAYADSIEYDGGFSEALLWLVDNGA